jgi:hypothetical protein
MADAHEQIRNLLGRYCALMDAGDFVGLSQLFSDATLADEHGNVFATGADEIKRMWDAQTILHDGSPRTRHITANPVIDVDVDVDVATCTSSYIVFQGIDDFPLQPIASGRYADTFGCDDAGRWRWTQRRYAIDHAGDLSHHLRTS